MLADALEKLTVAAPAVTKSDDEWKSLLSPEEYEVIRGAGTEAAHTGETVCDRLRVHRQRAVTAGIRERLRLAQWIHRSE